MANEQRIAEIQDELQRRSTGSTSTDNARQTRIQQLQTEIQRRQQQLDQQNKRDTELINQLQGALPSSASGKPIAGRPTLGGDVSKEYFKALELDKVRQGAYDELVRSGKTPQQIELVAQVNKRITKGPPTLGRTLGAIAGTVVAGQLIPGPVDEIVGVGSLLTKAARVGIPLLGAGTGGGIGEATQIGIEEKRLLDKSEFWPAFLKETAFEAGGRTAVLGAKFAFSPFIKKTIPGSVSIAEEYAKLGAVVPVSNLDDRLTLKLGDEVVRGAFMARDIADDMLRKSAGATVTVADHFLDEMAGSVARLGRERLGTEFAEGITRPGGRVFTMMDDLFHPLYDRVDELTATKTKRVFGDVARQSQILDDLGQPITRTTRKVVGEKLTAKLSPGFEELEELVEPATFDIIKLKKFAARLKREEAAFLKPGAKQRKVLLDTAGHEYVGKIESFKRRLTGKQLRAFRSKLLRDGRKLSRDLDVDEKLIKEFEQITFDIMTDPSAAKNFPAEAKMLHENLSRLYRSTRIGIQENFSEKLAERLAKNPSAIIKEVFPQGNSKAIRNLRKSLVEPISGKKSKTGERLFKQLRTAWFADAVEKSIPEGEIVKPHLLETAIRRMGKQAIGEMTYDDAGKIQMFNIRNLLKTMSKKPSGGASLFIRGGQVGGAVMMVRGSQEGDMLQVGAGGILLMGPVMFARLAANPLGNKLLRSGVKIRPGATSLAPNTARIVNLAKKLKLQEISEKEKIEKGRAARARGLGQQPRKPLSISLSGIGKAGP